MKFTIVPAIVFGLANSQQNNAQQNDIYNPYSQSNKIPCVVGGGHENPILVTDVCKSYPNQMFEGENYPNTKYLGILAGPCDFQVSYDQKTGEYLSRHTNEPEICFANTRSIYDYTGNKPERTAEFYPKVRSNDVENKIPCAIISEYSVDGRKRGEITDNRNCRLVDLQKYKNETTINVIGADDCSLTLKKTFKGNNSIVSFSTNDESKKRCDFKQEEITSDNGLPAQKFTFKRKKDPLYRAEVNVDGNSRQRSKSVSDATKTTHRRGFEFNNNETRRNETRNRVMSM